MTRARGPSTADDAILIEGIEIPAALGVTAAERAMRRPVRIDLEAGCSLHASGQSDRIEDTLDYGKLFEVLQQVVTEREHQLVEALGERIARALFASFGEIEWVTLHIRKPNPLAGVLDYVGVRLTRYRSG